MLPIVCSGICADLRKGIDADFRVRIVTGVMITIKGIYPFVDAVGERSYLGG